MSSPPLVSSLLNIAVNPELSPPLVGKLLNIAVNHELSPTGG